MISVIPQFLSAVMVCSMSGFPPTGISGFGLERVNGSMRVPFPAAIITTFTKIPQ